jgi:hypothetical protein
MSEDTLAQIIKRVIVLFRDRGPVDAVRFLHLYDKGHGDYPKERSQWLLRIRMNFFQTF